MILMWVLFTPIFFSSLTPLLTSWGILISLIYMSTLPHGFSVFMVTSQNTFLSDQLSFSLSLLTLWAWGAVVTVQSHNSSPEKFFKKAQIILTLCLTLMFAFNSSNLLTFYAAFETSLFPIFLLILGWGYQPERLYAGMSLLFYTVVASLPLLLSIALMVYQKKLSNFLELDTNFFLPLKGFILQLSLILGFLVKLPLFGFHLWLPRAHVEAPVEGSMLLAAMLLKLGAYAVFRLNFFLMTSNKVFMLIQTLALLGGAFMSILSARQTDMKTLIAYSSVAHMGLGLATLMFFKTTANYSAILALISHGFISSGLFMGANILYSRSQTRNITLVKAILPYWPVFALFWFVMALGNMGTPPSPNFFAEMVMIFTLMNQALIMSFPIIVMTGMATLFTLNLYMASQHHNMNFSIKNFTGLFFVEMAGMAFHFLPALMGLLAAYFLL